MKKNNVLNVIFILISTFVVTSLTAQEETCDYEIPQIAWEEFYSKKKYAAFISLAESYQGGVLAVGEAEEKPENKKDLYLVMVDSLHKIIWEKQLGGEEDDGASCVIKTFDGAYLVVGYSDSQAEGHKGARDGWVLKFDERGKILWSFFFGSDKEDEFKWVSQMSDGSYILAGSYHKKGWLLRLDESGNKEWEKHWTHEEYFSAFNAGSLTRNGDIILTGYVEAEEHKQMLYLKVDREGNEKDLRIFPGEKAEIGTDIIETKEGNYAITGLANTRKSRKDLCLMILRSDGEEITSETMGGRGQESGNALIQIANRNLLLAGYTSSHIREAKRPKMWLKATNQFGIDLWSGVYGSKLYDEGMDLIQKSNGTIVVAGIGNSNKAWLMEFDLAYDTIPLMAEKPVIKREHLPFVYPESGIFLEAGQRGYHPIWLTNFGEADAYNVKAEVSCSNCTDGLYFYKEVAIGHLAINETKMISIPVFTKTNLTNKLNHFKVRFSEAGGNKISSVNFTVRTRPEAQADLAISYAGFDTDDNFPERGDTIYLKTTITNLGNKTSTASSLYFNHIASVTVLDKNKYRVPALEPGASVTLNFPFVVAKSYPDKVLSFRFELENNYPLKNPECLLVLNQPSEEESVFPVNGAKWVMPNPSDYGSVKFNWYNNILPIQVKVKSKKKLKKKNFQLVFGSQICEGCKTDEASLNSSDVYIYSDKIRLKPGINKIRVDVSYNKYSSSTETLEVNYIPEKPNLYVLAIGVPHEDLKYTSQDAKDFGLAFEKQNDYDGLFDQVYIDTLCSKENTTRSEILYGVRKLQQYNICPKDIVAVFISSHGSSKTSGSVRLKCSDYKGNNIEGTTIDYEKDLIAELELVGGKRLVFIDACNSGNFDGNKEGTEEPESDKQHLSTQIQKIMDSSAEIKTIASCQAKELSYENEQWENGAFTEALLEAFKNVSIDDTKGHYSADGNDDGFLTLEEVYSFVRKRVTNEALPFFKLKD